MNQGESLLQAIFEHPADDAVRLVYADWLEENGECERAEFIRVQVELAGLPACTKTRAEHLCCRFCDAGGTAMLRRQLELLSRHWSGWCRGAGLPPCQTRVCRNLIGGSAWKLQPGEQAVTFSRGFISAVRLPLQAWLDHGHALVRAHPLTRVELSDHEPLPLSVEPAGPSDPWAGRYAWSPPIAWTDPPEEAGEGDPDALLGTLPAAVFALLTGRRLEGNPVTVYEPSLDAAKDDLSGALLAWAKRQP